MYDKYASVAKTKLRLESDAYLATKTFVERVTDESTPDVHTSQAIRPHCVNIPVAAHQDAHLIHAALGEYAKQKNSQPITTILHLNAPSSEPAAIFDEAYDQIERARTDYPHLDIRSMQTQYNEPRIGKIRSDLWKTALKTAVLDGSISPTSDVIGYNHDIDIEHLPTNYFAAVEKWYDKRKRGHALVNASLDLPAERSIVLPYATTRAMHGYRFDTHHNSSAVIAWSNLLTRLNDNSYEAALIFPFSRYAKSGGYQDDDATHETRSITQESRDDLQPINKIIPSLPLVTSPRRYLDRLHYGGIDTIWQEGTFSATDTCREATQSPDITKDQAREYIMESIRDTFLGTATLHSQKRLYTKLRRNNYDFLHTPGDLSFEDGAEIAPIMAEEYRLTDEVTHIANRALRKYLGQDAPTISYQHTSDSMLVL
jgi:hypothetical protein